MRRDICFILFLFAGWSWVPAEAAWLPREIHEVRAYVYDYTQEDGNISLLKKGRLHSGVINRGGATLSEKQVERLKDALRSDEDRVPGALCYLPHHGFVFYDEAGVAMGHIELCFQCRNVDSSPKGLPEKEWDWKAIRQLLKELEIPVLEKSAEYTKLYEEMRAKTAGDGADE